MEGRWVRGGVIGKGSFGTVSLAVDLAGGGIFAVKSVNLNSSPERAVAALENEIRLLSSLDSPHVVSYLGDDVTEEPGGRYRNLHLEYLPGGTAADVAAAAGKMREGDLRSYARSVARALQYLHTAAGVVHGDVKGRNVLLGSPEAAAKLADFGSARRGSGEAARGEGTPLWMAPEVARGEAATPASDVWSLGCTVIELAGGGKQPWGESGIAGGGDPPAQLLRIAFREVSPEFPPWLSKSAHDFLDKCLRRDPGDRWTCEQLLRHSFLADSSEPSPRSIFELGEMELEFEDEEEDIFKEDEDRRTESARDRLRELASPEVEWGSDGWVEVRSSAARKETSAAAGESSRRWCGRRVEGGGDAAVVILLICFTQVFVSGTACDFSLLLCSFIFMYHMIF